LNLNVPPNKQVRKSQTVHPEFPPEVLVRNHWTGTYSITHHQKSILNKYQEQVMKEDQTFNNTTPLILKIAELTCLSVPQVLGYYKKRTYHARQLEKNEKKKRDLRNVSAGKALAEADSKGDTKLSFL